MEIGRKIMNLRKDRGVAQSSLADMTSVTPSALSRIEAGIHQPRGAVALRIARELGVTADYILDNDAPYPPPRVALLENSKPSPRQETRSRSLKVSPREKRLVEALRSLSDDEQQLLEATLSASPREIRLALFALGRSDQLDQHDTDEKKQFKKILNKL
ncbi:MAG: helix-turn-helix domain-containing protein [Planctomycetota bacterium]|nr:helix-turn-helix domain-containing protein [Planctomycetota bacterium]